VLGFVFSGGMFLIVYVILWIIMPSESRPRMDVIERT
jgi:phage shock protein PspC (stress-responsive transcriptional regulator)